MICQRCQKAPATVHVDELESFVEMGHEDNLIHQHHLCEACAHQAQLPGLSAGPQKTVEEIWHLLQSSATGSGNGGKPQLECEDCGTTLEELRRKGRIGCQGCYETFSDYLESLLERMHGAEEHVGRIPGVDEGELRRKREIQEAQLELQAAIDSEEFERAAELRDRLQDLGLE